MLTGQCDCLLDHRISTADCGRSVRDAVTCQDGLSAHGCGTSLSAQSTSPKAGGISSINNNNNDSDNNNIIIVLMIMNADANYLDLNDALCAHQ